MSVELQKVLLRVLPFLGIFLGLLIAVKRKKIHPASLALQKPNSVKWFIFWWAGFLLFILLTEVLLHHFGLIKVGKWNNTFFPTLIKIIGIVILAPIGEELVFRGILLHKLKQGNINSHVAIFIQAVLFTLVHSAAFDLTLLSNIGKLQIFTDAMLFAYAKENTKSIFTPITMHAMGNLIAVIEQFIL